jgi:hypothetical protein
VASLREKGLEKDLIIEQQAKNMKLMRSQFKHDALRFSSFQFFLSLGRIQLSGLLIVLKYQKFKFNIFLWF